MAPLDAGPMARPFSFTDKERDNIMKTRGCSGPNNVKILVADDHPLFRAALSQVLGQCYPEADLHTVANVPELQQQVEHTANLDLILLDLHMPGALGFSALSWLLGHHSGIPVIMISANSHPETVRRAIDHGAAAFMSKSADIEMIQDCLARVLAGDSGLHPGLEIAAEGASLQALDTADALASLTPQQFRVASMLVEGLLNKQIAYELDVKEATIKAHMTEIFRKLGVHSRTQAVLALGSLSVDTPDSIAQPPA